MSAREAVDALVMALDTPLLAGMGANARIYMADYEMQRLGLSSGECATLRIADNLASTQYLLGFVDDRLAALAADALTALADEAIQSTRQQD